MNVTIAEMQEKLDEILRKAAAGEAIHVTKDGKPYVVVRARPEAPPTRRVPRVGAFVGERFWMSEDFDELGPEWDEYT